MERLFDRHDEYLNLAPTDFVRGFINKVNWESRLVCIKGPKGVGKSTLILQKIKRDFAPGDRHVLYCSADSGYFSTHTLLDTADRFVKVGGTHIFIDEIHKYDNWSQELKEIYDLYRHLHVVVSGSSLLEINSGKADLSRRMVEYEMPGLSFREYLCIETGSDLPAVSLESLLAEPALFCNSVKRTCRPLEYFHKYLKCGYYPFWFEDRVTYGLRVENIVNYIIDTELPALRSIEPGNTRKIKALLQIISQLVPFEIDIAKISRNIGIQRLTTLRYLKNLEEARLVKRLFCDLDTTKDLQKPDKMYLDNPNLLYSLAPETPNIGTVRECFFCNQLYSAGYTVEYGGMKSGDFIIDRDIVVEVGGSEKSFSQIKDIPDGYVAADDIDSAMGKKIPLWAFGFLY